MSGSYTWEAEQSSFLSMPWLTFDTPGTAFRCVCLKCMCSKKKKRCSHHNKVHERQREMKTHALGLRHQRYHHSSMVVVMAIIIIIFFNLETKTSSAELRHFCTDGCILQRAQWKSCWQASWQGASLRLRQRFLLGCLPHMITAIECEPWRSSFAWSSRKMCYVSWMDH